MVKTPLAWVLAYKMIGTLALIAGFSLGPRDWLDEQFGMSGNTDGLYWLYAISLAALLVGYATGLWRLRGGEFPWGIVVMGLVSNAGAAALLWSGPMWRASLPITSFVTSVALLLTGCVLARLIRPPQNISQGREHAGHQGDDRVGSQRAGCTGRRS